jgi:hypothetical protein
MGESKIENGKVLRTITIVGQESTFAMADMFAREKAIPKLEARVKEGVLEYVMDAERIMQKVRESVQPKEATGKKRGRRPKAASSEN